MCAFPLSSVAWPTLSSGMQIISSWGWRKGHFDGRNKHYTWHAVEELFQTLCDCAALNPDPGNEGTAAQD